MASISQKIKEWFNSFNEPLDFLLITFDFVLIKQILEEVTKSKNFRNLILSDKFLDGKYDFNELTTILKGKKIFRTSEFNKHPTKSLLFGDFLNSEQITANKLDYYKIIDRGANYRKNVKAICMYNCTANPPFNGFWYYRPEENTMQNIYFLTLSEWGKACQNKPTLVDTNYSNTFDMLTNLKISSVWLNNLKDRLAYFIGIFLQTDTYTSTILSEDNMIIWVKAFMHETYNYVYNYEGMEFLGDKLCSSKFSTYMVAKYPRLTQNELTEYHNQYMSAEHQSYISDDLGLTDFMLAYKDLNPTIKTKTDLFESFIGAVYLTCSKIDMCLADTILTNIFTLIGEQFPFEKKMIHGQNKHRITQILESLNFSPSVGDEFRVILHEENSGLATAVNTFRIVCGNKFEFFAKKYQLDLLFSLSERYNPNESDRNTHELKFWDKIANVFDMAKFDINKVKEIKRSNIEQSIIFNLMVKDNSLAQAFKLKLTSQYQNDFPNGDINEFIKTIQFKSNKESNNNYTIMYVHTFIADPKSKLLNSLSEYFTLSQKSGDDYIDDFKGTLQVTNLAVVPIPKDRVSINNETLTPYDSSCYNCMKEYVKGIF